MRINRKKLPIVAGPEITAGPPAPVDTTALREALIEALITETDDPVLTRKYRDAIATGMEVPDVSQVPRYKRIATIDAACDDHLALTAGGPCAICGTRKPRYAPGQTDAPQFVSLTGTLRACNWCHDRLQQYGGVTGGQDHLREVVAMAAVAVRGLPPEGSRYRFSHPDVLPFAHEVPGEGDGSPWSHVTSSAHRMATLRQIALAKFHPSRFCRTAGQCDSVAVPGIRPVPWTEDQIPKHETRHIGLSRKGKALQEQSAQFYAALKDERARREAQQAKRLERLRERDEAIAARLATLDEDEKQQYLEQIRSSA